MTEKIEARQTPLPDLLDRVPDDIVLGIPGDEPMFPSYTNIPIGKLARQAAAELRRLHAENERLAAEVANRNRRALDGDEAVSALANVHAYYEGLEAQRDALLEALKSTGLFLHHCWCDVQMNDYSFEKLNRQMEIVDAALMAAEETK